MVAVLTSEFLFSKSLGIECGRDFIKQDVRSWIVFQKSYAMRDFWMDTQKSNVEFPVLCLSNL